MNLLVGQKISITSNKPQTTRNKILSILTGDAYQLVFLDTPGIHVPKSKLGELMLKSVEAALNEVDVVLFLVEPGEWVPRADKLVAEKLANTTTPVFLVINKIDLISRAELLNVIEMYKGLYNFKEIIPVSATKAENTDELLAAVVKYLPDGPKYFPDDQITDQPEIQITSEIIREKALLCLDEEIPHGIAVEIIGMKKRDDKNIVDVEATIICEKDTHKGIIIGRNGTMLKRIGSLARTDIERLLGTHINLQLWVKIKKDWRNNDYFLRSMYDR